MNYLTFKLDVEPPTKTFQSKGFNRFTGTIYTKPEVKADKAKIKAKLLEHVDEWKRQRTSEETPVALNITYYFHTNNKKMNYKYKKTKPDLDNVTKNVLDVMEETGYFPNDSRISKLNVSKIWTSEKGFITISIAELGEYPMEKLENDITR